MKAMKVNLGPKNPRCNLPHTLPFYDTYNLRTSCSFLLFIPKSWTVLGLARRNSRWVICLNTRMSCRCRDSDQLADSQQVTSHRCQMTGKTTHKTPVLLYETLLAHKSILHRFFRRCSPTCFTFCYQRSSTSKFLKELNSYRSISKSNN